MVARLTELKTKYRELLDKEPVETVSFDEVALARRQGQDNLLGVVAYVTGHCSEPTAGTIKRVAPYWPRCSRKTRSSPKTTVGAGV
jgi:hypothetical protein